MGTFEQYRERCQIRELPQEFVEWNLGKHRQFLNAMVQAAERG